MKIGVPREIKPDEYRVAILPVGVEELGHAGHTVLVESGAGQGSGIADAEYHSAGGTVLADAVAAALTGPMTAALPASLLQAVAGKVTWILDEPAAGAIPGRW